MHQPPSDDQTSTTMNSATAAVTSGLPNTQQSRGSTKFDSSYDPDDYDNPKAHLLDPNFYQHPRAFDHFCEILFHVSFYLPAIHYVPTRRSLLALSSYRPLLLSVHPSIYLSFFLSIYLSIY